MGCLNSTPLQPPDADGDGLKAGEPKRKRSVKGPLSEEQIKERLTTCERSLDMRIGTCNVNFAFLSQRGYYPDQPTKENQDSFVAVPKFDGRDDMSLFGVFDGHGREGHLCARFVADKVPSNLAIFINRGMDLEEALFNAMVVTNRELHESGIDDTLSGTTAIVLLMHNNLCYIANVGDSRAIVAQELVAGRVTAKALSSDQTPYRRDECVRVKAAGARVMSMDQIDGLAPMHENWGDIQLGEELDEGGDPPRVWSPYGDYPGTAFTRSLGDSLAEELGVFAEPEILVRELHMHDNFLVIASDGVFEFLTNQAVADMVKEIPDPLAACQAVVEESYNLWLRYEVRTDDITMIALYLDLDPNTKPTRASVKLDESQLGVRPVRRVMSREKKKVIANVEDVLQDSENDVLDMNALAVEKTAAEAARIEEAVRANFLFRHLNDQQMQEVISVMAKVEVSEGDVIIRQNDEGDRFYIADSGTFEVRVAKTPQEAVAADGAHVHTYHATANNHPGFGELALMYSHPRAASVVAATGGLLWALDRQVFRHVVLRRNRKALLKTLRSVEILSSLTVQQLQRLTDVLTEESAAEGATIIRQGEVGDSMYILKSGSAACFITDEAGERKNVLQLRASMYFGERALLQSEPRAADVVALTDCNLLTISKAVFEEVLGPLQDIIDADRRRRERRSSRKQMAPAIDAIDIFGTVALEQDVGAWLCASAAGAHVTLRAVSKAGAEAHGLGTALRNCADCSRDFADEHDVGEHAHSLREERGLCLPSFTYNVGDQVFFLYERRLVANLRDLFDTEVAPPEAQLLHMIGCLAKALQAMHDAGGIFRSFSLEHVFLDENGDFCAVDLAFTKHLAGAERTFTICGTAEYLAPEQVTQAGYDKAVDWWALGSMMYEVIHGKTPFVGASELAIYNNITSHRKGTVEFDTNVPLKLQTVIENLLDPNPSSRKAYAADLLGESFPEVSPIKDWAQDRAEQLMAEGQRQNLPPSTAYTGEGGWFDGF